MIEQLRETYCNADSCGPARAQVLTWSARRVLDLLRYRGRRPLDLAMPQTTALTGQERTLAALFAALDAGDEAAALRHAQWLVPTTEAARLVRWAQPVVECASRLRVAA